MTNQETIALAVEAITGFETVIPWMYLDTNSIVTVGIGNALETLVEAVGLPFRDGNGNISSADKVQHDYLRVKGMKPGFVARYYRVPNSPTLSIPAIKDLAAKHVRKDAEALEPQMDGFSRAPQCAQIALLDMAYNLGIAGLMKFGNLRDAISKGDYESAANNCHRKSISEERNSWTQNQFLKAREV